MKYTGQFRGKNEILYTVDIITNNSETQTSNITLGVSPFVTSMNTSGETLYKVAKYQSATIKLVTESYYFDMYAAKAHDTKVVLSKEGGTVEWIGYLTPNVYNNPWTGGKYEIELEAIDGLSTLQYFKYQPLHNNQKSIVTFTEILDSILDKCDCYNEYYFSANTKLSQNNNNPLLNQLVISEENFFKSKDDENKTDDDVAWTMKEVLEEICRFLGVTAVAYNRAVYFIDYDAIKNGNNYYWSYTIGDATNANLIELSANYAIEGTLGQNTIAEGGQNIVLDDVYNKVTIKDNLYKYTSVIPDVYKYGVNITKSTDPDLSSSTNVNNGMYGEVVGSDIGNEQDKVNNNMIAMIDRIYDPQEHEYTDFNAVFVKYFTNPYYKFYYYPNGNNNTTRHEVSSLNYTDTKNFHGAFIAKFDVEKLEEKIDRESFGDVIYNIQHNTYTLDKYLAKNEVGDVSLSNYIVMINSSANHITNDNITSYPYFETYMPDTTALFGGENAYLVISGSYAFHVFDNDPYPIPQGEADISEGRYAIDDGHGYLLCKLQWGDKYWNGEEWTTTNSTFHLNYLVEHLSSGKRRADNVMFKDNSFVNTVSWRIGTSEKGYCIKCPNDIIMSGLPHLTVYKPFDPNYHSTKSGDNEGQHYKMYCVFLKNFNIKAVIGDPTYSDKNNTDTEYTNIINLDHVNELKKIEFKINTWDNKSPNYSCVGVNNNGVMTFLDKTYNVALSNDELNWIDWNNDSDGMMRQEEHMIYRICNQYTNPAITMNITLKYNNNFKPYSIITDKFLPNKYFIVNEMNHDYYAGSVETKIIEKK